VLSSCAWHPQLPQDVQTGVGAVLLQDGHPLAYVSKPLGPKTRGLSICEKEYLAILIAVEHTRSYMQLAEFIIFTDQKSLTHLNDQRLNTMGQQKVFTKLLGLRYHIVYKKKDLITPLQMLYLGGCMTMGSVVLFQLLPRNGVRMSYKAIIMIHKPNVSLSN
jgi:hypothetical protein